MGFDAVDRKFKPKEIKLECTQCDATFEVMTVPSRAEPGSTVVLCKKCRIDYNNYWNQYEAWN